MSDNPFLLPRRPSAESSGPETALPQPAATTKTPPAPRTPARWSLRLADGTRIAIDRAVVLGRDPLPPAGAETARAVALVDPGKTVSKTHALVELAGDVGLRVRDLHSTNGVAIGYAGARVVLPAGGEGIAASGATIELGSFVVQVSSGRPEVSSASPSPAA